jgi:hypothetical protein
MATCMSHDRHAIWPLLQRYSREYTAEYRAFNGACSGRHSHSAMFAIN